jgi:hypothetical protein
MKARHASLALALAMIGTVLSGLAAADPLPGEILKFQQLPLNNGGVPGIPAGIAGAPFPGHDELSTATLDPADGSYHGIYMADDFADHFDTPVVHVRWWGSYIQNQQGSGVKDFLITFENDVPLGDPNNPLPFSHPGDEKFNQIVHLGPLAPGSGTFTETFVPTPPLPDGGPPLEALYEYNAELHLGKEFVEKHDTVYWLKIVALVDPSRDGFIKWGWHNRDWSIPDPLASTAPAVVPGEFMTPTPFGPVWHFQDDAVTGPIVVTPVTSMPNMPDVVQDGWTPTHYEFPFDGPEQIQQFSKDLAFELYTRIPEPGSLLLMVIGAVGCMTMRRRRK